jgi:hypothetical protein
VFGLPGAEGVGGVALIEFLSIRKQKLTGTTIPWGKRAATECACFTTRITLLTSF